MSNYTQEQETVIVKDAMTLTAAIEIGEAELTKQKNAQFKAKPAEPQRKQLEIPQVPVQMPPEPKTDYSFGSFIKDNLVYIVGALFFLPVLLYAYLKYCQKKKEIEEQLKQGDEYQQALKAAKERAEVEQQKINADIARQQAEIDAKYTAELENYNTVIVPEYNREYEAWKIAQKMKIKMIEEEVLFNKETLEALYTSTKLISTRYRKLPILQWLYEELSSSDVTFERAIDLYNDQTLQDTVRDVGKDVTASINNMHASMVSGFNSVYDAIDEGNEILAKTRRDQNLANTADIIQRHKLNKMVKAQSSILEKHFNQ